jgi:hypothetical protein
MTMLVQRREWDAGMDPDTAARRGFNPRDFGSIKKEGTLPIFQAQDSATITTFGQASLETSDAGVIAALRWIDPQDDSTGKLLLRQSRWVFRCIGKGAARGQQRDSGRTDDFGRMRRPTAGCGGRIAGAALPRRALNRSPAQIACGDAVVDQPLQEPERCGSPFQGLAHAGYRADRAHHKLFGQIHRCASRRREI